MPQIMVEAFARGLVDKIMLEALDVLDTDEKDEKWRTQGYGEQVVDRVPRSQSQSPYIIMQAQMHDHTHVEQVQIEVTEGIANMTRDLRNVQIGDTSFPAQSKLTKLEQQVKRAISNVDVLSPATSTGMDLHIKQGQGDVDRMIHGENVDRKERENCASTNDTARVSRNVLHRMIEELEMATEKSGTKNNETEEDGAKAAEEDVVAWEEKEEKFVRIIEGLHEVNSNLTRALCGVESVDHGYLENEESRSSLRSEQIKNNSFEEIVIEGGDARNVCAEATLHLRPPSGMRGPADSSILHMEGELENKSFSSTGEEKQKARRKRGLGQRVRKLFRAAFGRRKN